MTRPERLVTASERTEPGEQAPVQPAPSAPGSPVLYLLLPAGLGLAVIGLVILSLGQNPLEVLAAVFNGAFGSVQGLNRTVARATPLLLLSAGLLVAFRARFWYIGANGAMIVGAIAASGIALYNPDGPGWLYLPLMLLGGVTKLETMERALGEGFELIAMGRGLIRDPDLVQRLQSGELTGSRCVPCNRCVVEMERGGTRCVMRPAALAPAAGQGGERCA